MIKNLHKILQILQQAIKQIKDNHNLQKNKKISKIQSKIKFLQRLLNNKMKLDNSNKINYISMDINH